MKVPNQPGVYICFHRKVEAMVWCSFFTAMEAIFGEWFLEAGEKLQALYEKIEVANPEWFEPMISTLQSGAISNNFKVESCQPETGSQKYVFQKDTYWLQISLSDKYCSFTIYCLSSSSSKGPAYKARTELLEKIKQITHPHSIDVEGVDLLLMEGELSVGKKIPISTAVDGSEIIADYRRTVTNLLIGSLENPATRKALSKLLTNLF